MVAEREQNPKPPPLHARSDGLSVYVTPADAAALLGVTESCVRKWFQQGKLRGQRLGKLIRLERRSVERALPAPEAEPDAPAPPVVEQVLALLPALSDAERQHVAVMALTLPPRPTVPDAADLDQYDPQISRFPVERRALRQGRRV